MDSISSLDVRGSSISVCVTMRNNLCKILLMCVLLAASGIFVCAQESVDVTFEKKYTIYFRVNESEPDPEYLDNAKTLETMVREISSALNSDGLVSCRIEVSASASPEGNYKHNERLSKRRMDSVLSALKDNIDIADVTFHTNSQIEDWAIVAAYIEADEQAPCRPEVLQVISGFDGQRNLKYELEKISGGAYDYIAENFFPLLRSAKVIAAYDLTERYTRHKVPAVNAAFSQGAVTVSPKLRIPEPPPVQVVEPEPEPRLQFIGLPSTLKVKTNLIGLALGHANIAVEYPFAEHFSVALPFYYSGGFDYFKETIKFRGIVLQPEVRYYLHGNEGFYAGAHFGLGWYNYALDGEFRIQDHKGRTPAYGGGLGLGYSFNFKKNPRWGMEFAIGAGVYKAKYDILYNEHNGPYEETGVEKTFFGIDNASVAFTYNFDLRKEVRR